MKKTVKIIHGDASYHNLFTELGYDIANKLEDASLVVFTGGSDVTPGMYGAAPHPYTYNDIERDYAEREIFNRVRELGIPMVGICRGAQFLNVMSGGAMYQDVQGHTRSHEITDSTTGEVVYVSSTHHQMMKPSSKGILVASSTIGGAREWFEGQIFCKDVSSLDYEVVFYEETKCLCFQPHPEFNSAEYEGMRNYFNSLLERYYG